MVFRRGATSYVPTNLYHNEYSQLPRYHQKNRARASITQLFNRLNTLRLPQFSPLLYRRIPKNQRSNTNTQHRKRFRQDNVSRQAYTPDPKIREIYPPQFQFHKCFHQDYTQYQAKSLQFIRRFYQERQHVPPQASLQQTSQVTNHRLCSQRKVNPPTKSSKRRNTIHRSHTPNHSKSQGHRFRKNNTRMQFQQSTT